MLRSLLLVTTITILLALSWPYLAVAASTTFFGEDLNPSSDPNNQITHPNADVARDAFMAQLITSDTELFDSYPLDDPPATFTFGTEVAAVVAVGDVRIRSDLGGGVFPISGTQWLFINQNSSTTIEFINPQIAVSFYAMDVGDLEGNQLVVTLFHVDGQETAFDVPHGFGELRNGAVLYFGVIDDNPFSSIKLANVGNNVDGFGFDNLTISPNNELAQALAQALADLAMCEVALAETQEALDICNQRPSPECAANKAVCKIDNDCCSGHCKPNLTCRGN